MGCLNSYAYFIPFGSPLPVVSIKFGYNHYLFNLISYTDAKPNLQKPNAIMESRLTV